MCLSKLTIYTFISVTAFLFTGLSANAQDAPLNQKFGLGFHLTQHQKDFGLGIDVTSPYFVHGKMAVRMRGNLVFNEHVQGSTTTWSPYSNLSLGLIGVGGEVNGFLRLYGEGGFILLFPSDEFSSANTELGGYGLFGFEFHMSPHKNYYIEIGGVGTGASADKVENSPIYSNGLLINVGFRHQF